MTISQELRYELVKSFEQSGYTNEMAQAVVEKILGKENK